MYTDTETDRQRERKREREREREARTGVFAEMSVEKEGLRENTCRVESSK